MSWYLGIQRCAALSEGCVYGLAIATQAQQSTWFSSLFLAAGERRQGVTLLSSQPRQILQHGATQRALKKQPAGGFYCYELKRQQIPQAHLLKAFRRCQPLAHRLLILELPVDYFDLDTAAVLAQLSALRDYAKQQSCTILLLLEAENPLQSQLHSLQHMLSGYVCLQGAAEGLVWQQSFWINQHRVAGELHFYLYLGENQQLQVQAPKGTQSAPQDFTPATIVAERAVMQGQKILPRHWLLGDDINTVINLAAEHNAAGIILAFTTEAKLKNLALSLHRVRSQLGLDPIIFVRETEQIIRLQDERMLLRLGATAVLPKALDFSRCLRLLHSYFGNSNYIADSEQVEYLFENTRTVHQSGYLPIEKFCPQAIGAVERSIDIGVQNTLIRLETLLTVGMLDSLATFKILRDGDFFSNWNDSIYLYFHACPEADVDFAITKVLHLPVQLVFAGQQRYCDQDSLLWQLKDLQRAAQHQGHKDFSSELSEYQAGESKLIEDYQKVNSPKQTKADLFAHPLQGHVASQQQRWHQAKLLSG